MTINARGAVLDWQKAPPHATTTAGYTALETTPLWRSGDEMTGGVRLPRLMVLFAIQPFAPQCTPECYQRMLEDLEGELLEFDGHDPRAGGTWERHVIRAEFHFIGPTKVAQLAAWWVEKAAALAALAHLEAGAL